jgi:hypothetical protein
MNKLPFAPALLGALLIPVSAALAQPQVTELPAGTAQVAPSNTFTTTRTPIGVLVADPAAKAVVDKYIPGLTDSPRISRVPATP